MKRKYDFYSGCGASYLETFETSLPETYASELATFRGINLDEITWEPAEGTVDGFDKFFPLEITPGERAKIGQIEALHAEIRQANISLDAAGIKLGKLHERVAGACQLLTEYAWQINHYKELYEAARDIVNEQHKQLMEAKRNDE